MSHHNEFSDSDGEGNGPEDAEPNQLLEYPNDGGSAYTAPPPAAQSYGYPNDQLQNYSNQHGAQQQDDQDYVDNSSVPVEYDQSNNNARLIDYDRQNQDDTVSHVGVPDAYQDYQGQDHSHQGGSYDQTYPGDGYSQSYQGGGFTSSNDYTGEPAEAQPPSEFYPDDYYIPQPNPRQSSDEE